MTRVFSSVSRAALCCAVLAWTGQAARAHYVVGSASRASSGRPPAAGRGARQPAPRRLALLIATGKDARGRYLSPSQNDLILIGLTLSGRFNYPASGIRVVGLDKAARSQLSAFGAFSYGPERATKKAILDGFAWLRSQSKSPLDTIVLYYSGHGTYIRGRSNNEVGEYMDDEALAPEGSRGGRDLIIDDDLDRELDSLRSQRTTFIADCCFSGGMPKATEAEDDGPFPVTGYKDVRVVERNGIGILPRGKALTDTLAQIRRVNRSLLAACLFDERSTTNAWRQVGPEFSPMTVALCRFLWRTPGNVSWNMLGAKSPTMALDRKIHRLTGLLGSSGINPICYQARATSPIFLAPTPGYSLAGMLSHAQRSGTPAPVGRFILEGLPGRTRDVPASLPVSLPAAHRAHIDWFRTDWR